jgi:hypothetical protein
MKKYYRIVLMTAMAVMITATSTAQSPDLFFRAAGTPVNPKVTMSWNRYYTNAGIADFCNRLAKAYPNLVTISSAGKSVQGRDMTYLTVTEKNGVPDTHKPGYYVGANVHSIEIQGTEMAMYLAWYLCEMHASSTFIRELLRDKVFYIFPTINPDGREHFMTLAATPRSGLAPRDDDRDGLFDEDGFDDLNGDGERSQMRKRNPNGEYTADPDDPRKMVRVAPGEKGECDLLGSEGQIDNDNDGRTDEDGAGSYDANRDWGYNWRPNFIQSGADKYPFTFPESQAVREFGYKHPNITGTQSYHNSGGMILRGPSVEGGGSEVYSREDDAVVDAIGKVGERLIVGYRLVTIWSDMYTVWGGELDWWYASQGAFVYSNELWNGNLIWNNQAAATQAATQTGQTQGRGGQGQSQAGEQFSWDQYDFDRLLLAGDAFLSWREVDHPEHGKVEVGGFTKSIGRLHPGFILETDAHRNTCFLLYHAYQTPKLEITQVTVNNIGGGLKEVIAVIENKRMMPTHSAQNIRYRIDPPDYIYLDGGDVVAGLIVGGSRTQETYTEQKKNPQRMEIPNIRGNSSVKIKWIVSSGNNFTVRVESVKGGRATTTAK